MRLIGVLAALLLTAGLLLATTGPASAHSAAPNSGGEVVTPATTVPAQGSVWVNRQVRDFKHHRIYNSGGRRLPKKMKYALAHNSKSSHMSWWRTALGRINCMSKLSAKWYREIVCFQSGQAPTQTKLQKAITHVMVKCGGAAVIGYVGVRLGGGSKGWVGAGTGSASCLWGELQKAAH